jgi:F0F1-type ATP synthase membrane subunit b/b'
VIWFDVAWAESEHVAAAQHGEEGGLGWGFIFKLINFLVFFYIIFRVAKKQLPVILNKRQEEVTKALAEAKAKEEQAHTLLREYDKKLNGLGDLIQKNIK